MEIFQTPAAPFTLFNYADFALIISLNIILLVLLKLKVWKRKSSVNLILMLLFFVIIPAISMEIEDNNVRLHYKYIDGFNLWYIMLKIPVWWFVGVVNIIFLNILVLKYAFRK